jgi:hypothetical protein
MPDDPMVFVDAHVHIHDCFKLEEFLYSAARNFANAKKQIGADSNPESVLMLTETAAADYFTRLLRLAGQATGQQRAVTFHKTKEPCSLHAELGSGQRLTLVAGRQIVTAEKLEVLALGTEQQFRDGEPILEVIDKVRAVNALAVVPWGFGKWLGRRGRVMDKLLENCSHTQFYLGDNSGRMKFMFEPRHFARARDKNIAILPGSDPLPFGTEYWRPGSFGFAVKGVLSKETPTADLKQLLSDQANSIIPFGNLERPLRFLRNQIAMQVKKQKY